MANQSANKAFIGFTIGSTKIQFLGRKAIYDGLKTQLGLDQVSETTLPGYAKMSIRDMVKNGYCIVLSVSGKSGAKSKSGKVVCPIDKATTAIPALKQSAKYGGWDIKDAYQSGDRRVSY